MGAIPNRLPGFADILDPDVRARFDGAWGSSIPPEYGMHLTQMFDAMGRGDLTRPLCAGREPGPVGGRRRLTPSHLLEGLDHLVVQDIFLTKTAELADVVLPATAAWCEAEGTVTNSERRVQRVRKAIEPPDGARDDIEILLEIARRLGQSWATTGSTDPGLGRGGVGRAALALAACTPG